ncbi:structural maintenance of chromosomes protein 5-like isoform X1 [Carassius gibelio]|uniref:structural maintenance of chromosomes protein 5-like isoform X1 n=1 Tax=Carassius gibelio TaxID=101364 RepID=UPI0022783778|nr:structural maintenance of chromosomes protein 5-like isoform X1 [Carassius gibelio]
MLMYALHMVFEAPFDFTASDFPLIRKWWCLILMENFAIERKHAAVDVHEPPKAQEDTETGDMEPQMVRDLRTAVGWLRNNCHSFRGSVQEPSYLNLEKEEQEEALLKLDRAERKDDLELAKEPFMFRFQFQQDMEVFLFECHDERHLRINSMFMEFSFVIYFSLENY